MRSRPLFAFAVVALLACDTPHTLVVLDNQYAPSTTNVIYQAFWQSVSFTVPVQPGSSSDPLPTVFASPNTAYVVLAPGWDPTSSVAPTSFVVLESKTGFDLHFDSTLHIPVDDTTFNGSCAAGSPLSQAEADFVTQRVFAQTFAGLHYDAARCTSTGGP